MRLCLNLTFAEINFLFRPLNKNSILAKRNHIIIDRIDIMTTYNPLINVVCLAVSQSGEK